MGISRQEQAAIHISQLSRAIKTGNEIEQEREVTALATLVFGAMFSIADSLEKIANPPLHVGSTTGGDLGAF